MIMFAVIVATCLSQIQPIDGHGSTYIFIDLSHDSEHICEVSRSSSLNLKQILGGFSDHEICIDGARSTQSLAEIHLDIQTDGFDVFLNGWGDAVGLETHDAFSRHDINSTIHFGVQSPLRIRADWMYLAAGLGSFQFSLQQLYDSDGTWNPQVPIIERTANAYIEPLTDHGVDVLHLPPGQWQIRAISTHQAMDPAKEGFQHSFARTNHFCTYVALGDANGDEQVDVNDLLAVIDSWGNCPAPCQNDLNSDGIVNIDDALRVLADWSP